VQAGVEATDGVDHRQFATVDCLREESTDSVRELGFDEGDVSEDRQFLSRLEVVTCETDGRAETPRLKNHHVFVEPLV
jgi:hypothetical protein